MTLIRLTDCPCSKRMYDKRFREWGVFKNVNSDERTRAARRAHSSASATGLGGDNDNNFSQEDLRRTIQCARTIQQGVKRAPTAEWEVPSIAAQDLGPQHPNRQPRRSISIPDLLGEGSSSSSSQSADRKNSLHNPSSPGAGPDSTQASISASLDESHQGEDKLGHLVVSNASGPGLSAYQAQLRDLFKSPPPTLTPDAKTRTMDFITLKLREYYDWQLDHVPEGVLPDDYLGHRSSEESARYWSTIKEAIYLVKVSAASMDDSEQRPDRRAWSAFAETGPLAAGAMTSHPFDFLRNLFATLSPANTSARPELRGILLKFLASEAQSHLMPNHPISQICKALQNDEGCQEISQRGLQCMLDIFNSRLGRSRAITFKLLDSLATLLRRSGEYHAGLEIINELLKVARPVFGPDSEQARSVENELAHFYMLAGDSDDLALGHCMSVVTRPPTLASTSSQEEPVFYQDGIAAHAMEDIAEIHQRRGDLEQCITWLERAASIALVVWGPKSIATGHLIDKMTNLQRQFGKDLLRSATLWESAIV
ncbi:cd2b6683-6d43-4272-aa86-78c796d713ea [Thermothielavioides terrestris]|uniref:Cd2b6683-6d43-4272-aa86-78c796d713ea n=1 Tax=Thermothielavioides terrestris TaxID=2587410 RepID=A0A446BDP3_9PEZI|nr:cd2b6683-6d43-4272-aa86-78c796d713ea [Thermothielavioides terrestris]